MSGMQSWNDRVIAEFRENGGRTGQWGRALVLLHHVGAKTGTARIAPVMSFRTSDDGWLIVASKAGAPEHPAWFHNLLAHPDVEIETADDGTVAVRASVLEGPERDEAWERITAKAAGFADYQAKTSRTIPVVKLTRR